MNFHKIEITLYNLMCTISYKLMNLRKKYSFYQIIYHQIGGNYFTVLCQDKPEIPLDTSIVMFLRLIGCIQLWVMNGFTWIIHQAIKQKDQ